MTPASSSCLLDSLGVGGPSSAPTTDERYLIYGPQFGLSHQLVALRNALAWASLLNRTLVLPHLLGQDGQAAFGQAHDLAQARVGVAPVALIEMDRFAEAGIRPERLLQLRTRVGLELAEHHYLRVALKLPDAPPLEVPLGTFTAAAIQEAFGGCAGHRALAFGSLLGALDHAPLTPSPQEWSVQGQPGLQWLDTIALPALLAPSRTLAALVSRLVGKVLAGGGDAAGGDAATGRTLGCVHLRRGDFEEECAKYDAEIASRSPRPWVRSPAAPGRT